MSLSLLSVNSCAYASCGLHFHSLYDLIAHIELSHIPAFEEERQKCSTTGEDGRHNVAPNLPLSAFQRVFPTPYRPQPCKPEIIKVSFNHYRKRLAPGLPPVGSSSSHSGLTTTRIDEDLSTETSNDDYDECTHSDPEMRFRCHYVDCGKRYKMMNALKHHMKTAHSIPSTEEAIANTQTDSASSTHSASTNNSPTKYAATRPHKCQQCSKRYKTTQGLQNHVAAAHQKPNGGSTNGDAVNPSPAVVAQLITQARAHGQQAAQQQAQVQAQIAAERAQLASQHNASPAASPSRGPPLPVSVAPQTASQQHFIPQNAPLPVRSIQVQSGRVVSQPSSQFPPGQTTGQMLQQQLQQQRRQQQYMQHQQSPASQQSQQQQHFSEQQFQQSPSSQHGEQSRTPPASQLQQNHPSPVQSVQQNTHQNAQQGTHPTQHHNYQQSPQQQSYHYDHVPDQKNSNTSFMVSSPKTYSRSPSSVDVRYSHQQNQQIKQEVGNDGHAVKQE